MKQKLFTLLTLLCFAVSGAWATSYTWSFANGSGTISSTTTEFTSTSGEKKLSYIGGSSDTFDGSSGSKYIKMGGTTQYSSDVYSSRYFTFLAPSTAGTVTIEYAGTAGNAEIATGTNGTITQTVITATANTSCTSSTISGLTAGTTTVYIAFVAKAYIKSITWTDVSYTTIPVSYYSLYKSTMETGATLTVSSAGTQTGGSGWYKDFANYYKTSSSSGYMNVTFSPAISLNSNGSNRGRIRLYYGHTSAGKGFTLNVNNTDIGSYTATVKNHIYVVDYTIPDGTTSLSTVKTTGSSSSGLCLFAIEVSTYAAAPAGDYTITKGAPSHGTIGVSATSADEGDEITLTETPDTGYEFTSWSVIGDTSGDEVTVTDNKFTMPAEDVTVDATFSAINYAITHSAASNGTYTIKVGDAEAVSTNTTANYGQTITLAATPADGYSLTSWGVTDEDDNAVTVTDNQFTMPAKAVTIAPTFAVIPDVTITTDLDDSYSMVINTKKTFTIAASGGTGTYTYQWYENDTESTAGATAISGKTSESYEINPTAAYDKYIYCVATSSAKSATSNIAHVTAAAITPSYKDFNSAETIVATTSANFATQLALSWMCDGNGGGSFTYSDNAYHKNGNVRVYPQLAKTTTEEIITAKAYDCVNVKKDIANNTLVTYVTGVSGVKAYTAPTGGSSRGVFIYAKENGTGDNVAEATASLNNTEKPLTYVTTLVGLDPEKNYAIYYVGVDNVSTNNPSNHMIAALKFNPTPDETFSLNSSGFATFSNQNSTAYSGATACKAALDYANSTITCTALTNNEAPAATGILLRGEASASVKVFYTGSNAVAGNNLHATTKADGTTEDMEVGYLYYVLSGDTFKKYTGAALAANKAFFKVDESTEVVSGKEWSIVFEDENGDVTGIKKVNGSQLNIDTYYDLSGRKVAQPTKGLYIVNGRKVVIK